MDRTSFASSVAPSGVDTLDQRLGFLGGTAVVNQYMCARLSKCQRSGSSNSTGSPRHQCRFTVKNHSYSPPLHELLSRALSEPTSEPQSAAAPVVIVGILSLSSRNRFVSKTKSS